jgi:hypothetical protein
MSDSLIFHRRREPDTITPPNSTTQFEDLLGQSISILRFDARKLFIDRYRAIKKALERHRKLGVLIMAFDERKEPIGEAWLAASLDRSRAAIVGRHSMCGIAVPQDQTSVSLRHLAILVRAISHTDARIRVLDLHTHSGFHDETGRVMQALSCEGSMFLGLGHLKFAVLVTDDSGVVAQHAIEQYACIPERVFLEERAGVAPHPLPRFSPQLVDALPPSATQVRSVLGPLAAVGDFVSEGEETSGELVVRGAGAAVRRAVGESALSRGILVGRYARCELGARTEGVSRLSRVHLLVIKDGPDVLALDTASSNGTFAEGKSIRLHRLEDGSVLDLGGELRVEWHQAD